jgi:hypothetical protein
MSSDGNVNNAQNPNQSNIDVSGRSTGSSSGTYGNVMNHVPQQQSQFTTQTAPQFAFPTSPSQQQRIFQMQMQHQYQLQQLQRQNQLQQQQRRVAVAAAAAAANASTTSTSVGANPPQSPVNRSGLLPPLPIGLGSAPNSLGSFMGKSPTGMSTPQQKPTINIPQQLPPPPPLQPDSNKSTTTAAPATAVPENTEKAKTVSNASNKRHSMVSLPPLAPEKALELLKKCDWVDKTLWASRQLLGGQSVNGFMRSTATVQRLKKQRARQMNRGKEKDPKSGSEQEQEEELKKEIMNPRFAKKLKVEFEQGIQFCEMLHETICNIVREMDPSFPPMPPLHARISSGVSAPNLAVTPSINATTATTSAKSTIVQSTKNTAPTVTAQHNMTASFQQSKSASAGDASGSTLRKNRKKKLPPYTDSGVDFPEIDPTTGKRVCAKKDYPRKFTELLRFRTLRKGDPVAARLTSRDLWILARVVKDYPASNLPYSEFLRLSDTRRENMFKSKVLVQDVESQEGANAAVEVKRSLVLPLPRNVSEAADWGSRYSKGSRVYAMYPHTTSLYTATVVDNTTYCRGDDDIIVVEFDGDEPDASGKIPQCHIPARFVSHVPREFLNPQPTTNPQAQIGKKRRSSLTSTSVSSLQNDTMWGGGLDDIDLDSSLPGLDGLDDLDFDLLGDA